MNSYQIAPGRIEGVFHAPPSKSGAQRAILAASLAVGRSELFGLSEADDIVAALDAARALGAEVTGNLECLEISGRINTPSNSVIDCGESALCARTVIPIAATFSQHLTITGRKSLLRRPFGMFVDPLKNLGAQVAQCTDGGVLPFLVKGPIHSGSISIDGSVTSQIVTGFLMALPLLEGNSHLNARNLVSRSYLRLTVELLREFGIRVESDDTLTQYFVPGEQHYSPTRVQIEGDWSGAAFILVAAALSGRIRTTGLRADSTQPDRLVMEALRTAGAKCTSEEDGITVESSTLRAFSIDLSDAPDLFPPLVALACYCEGQSELHGANRLAAKESNRGSALLEEFSKLGAHLTINDNKIIITGGKPLSGGTVSSHGDHRIAMALSVAALASKNGVTLCNPDVVRKSFPQFYRTLKRLAH